jgi:hypothetical protein
MKCADREMDGNNISIVFSFCKKQIERVLFWQKLVSRRWKCYLPMSPHGNTIQKNNTGIFTAVRTSNLTQKKNKVYCYTKSLIGLRFYVKH